MGLPDGTLYVIDLQAIEAQKHGMEMRDELRKLLETSSVLKVLLLWLSLPSFSRTGWVSMRRLYR